MAVRMELSRILIRELNDFQLIELREVLDEGETNGKIRDADPAEVENLLASDEALLGRSFPIVIGLPEAQAIERRLSGIEVKRPQTHDLLARTIEELGGELVSVTVTNLDEGTFFATLDVRNHEHELLHIDSRPSDAIALGIANNVPVYVEEHVLEAALEDQA